MTYRVEEHAAPTFWTILDPNGDEYPMRFYSRIQADDTCALLNYARERTAAPKPEPYATRDEGKAGAGGSKY
jgi:hypothetical protein